MQKWTLEIEFDDDVVADGINLTRDRALDMVQSGFPLISGLDFDVAIIGTPPKETIAKLQGYSSVADMEADS